MQFIKIYVYLIDIYHMSLNERGRNINNSKRETRGYRKTDAEVEHLIFDWHIFIFPFFPFFSHSIDEKKNYFQTDL